MVPVKGSPLSTQGPSGSFGRRALEISALRSIRTAIVLKEMRREQRFVERVGLEQGFMSLGRDSGQAMVSSGNEFFFILGSGASVEDLSARDFEVIERNFSVGINAWALHSFIPSAYVFEPIPERDTNHYRTLEILDRPEVLEKSPFVLVLRPRTPIEREQLEQLPASLRERTYLYGRVAPATRLAANLGGDINALRRSAMASRAPSVMLDSGASIVRMTSLALMLGFSKIVYVGVDLNNSRYFWEHNPAYLDRLGIKTFDSGQKTSVHETMSPVNRPFVVTEMIRGFVNATAPQGVQFFSGSESSALAEFLPCYRWPRMG